MQAYYYFQGIQQLAQKLSGTENICLAIRPYGFHAGNQIPFTIYPMLLCEELKKLGKEPRFTFFVVFNDWEQLKLYGPDIKRFPFNVLPQHTTLQYTPDPEGQAASIVDRWAPVISAKVQESLQNFPDLTIKAVRYSEFKNDKRLLNVLSQTLQKPEIFVDVLKKFSSKEVLNYPTSYVIAVCPNCRHAEGKTLCTPENSVQHFCNHCFQIFTGNLEEFDYWFYHTPLALPRYQILDIDLCITGADKIDESDYVVRKQLAEAYNIELKMPDVLYAPLITDKNGERMGKSRGNHVYVDHSVLHQMVRDNLNAGVLVVDSTVV